MTCTQQSRRTVRGDILSLWRFWPYYGQNASNPFELVPTNAHGAMHFPAHLILELWRYADSPISVRWLSGYFRSSRHPCKLTRVFGPQTP